MTKDQILADSELAIHCPTLEEADKLYKLLNKAIDKNSWLYYKENTCLYPYDGTYSTLNYAKEADYKIITASEIITALSPPTIKSLTSSNTVIHCDTEDKANQLLKWAHDQGLKWADGGEYIDNNEYKRFKDQTCYYLYEGTFSNKSTSNLENCLIIPFDSIKHLIEPKQSISTPEEEPDVTLKPITEMSIDHLYNTVNKVGMNIQRRRDCLLELWQRGYYLDYIFGPGAMTNKLPAHAYFTYACRLFSDTPWEYEYPSRYKTMEETIKKLVSAKVKTNEKIINRLRYLIVTKNQDSFQSQFEKDLNYFKKYINSNQSVALQEPTFTTTKPTKKDTFMAQLKQTALTTVDQNKQAAIIATKMEAGRVINKQVLKLAKPHVPVLFRGYLDTPLAPVILANAVAMLGNHTQNTKVQKISELMLLAAADVTVQSFNLDKIIDDVLANIKLPKGILDSDEE